MDHVIGHQAFKVQDSSAEQQVNPVSAVYHINYILNNFHVINAGIHMDTSIGAEGVGGGSDLVRAHHGRIDQVKAHPPVMLTGDGVAHNLDKRSVRRVGVTAYIHAVRAIDNRIAFNDGAVGDRCAEGRIAGKNNREIGAATGDRGPNERVVHNRDVIGVAL